MNIADFEYPRNFIPPSSAGFFCLVGEIRTYLSPETLNGSVDNYFKVPVV